MATSDRFFPAPAPEPLTPAPSEPSQGELFARLYLHRLPLMKGAPEDFWVLPEQGAARMLH